MDFHCALYDALVCINVPHDKARAVVDAMERDMTTTFATSADLQTLRTEMHQEFALVRKDLEVIRKDMEIMANSLTVRLGSMLFVAMGLLFAALQLT